MIDFRASIQKIYSNGYRRLISMVVLAILMSLIFVGVSLSLYYSSGAAQLDLSRPSYTSVSDQANSRDEDTDEYSATGSIDDESLREFWLLYQEQAEKIRVVDAFSGDPLSDAALGIDDISK